MGSGIAARLLFNIFVYSFFTALLSPFAYTGMVDRPDINKVADNIAVKIFVFLVFNIIFSPNSVVFMAFALSYKCPI